MDDTRKLCLANSENLLLPHDLALVFESDSLARAAPSTIGRCGIFSVAQRDLPWEAVYRSWVATLPSAFRSYVYTELISALGRELLAPILASLFNRAVVKKLLNDYSPAWVCQSFTRVFEAFLFADKSREELEDEYNEEKQRQARREAYMKLEGREEPEASPGAKKKSSLTARKVMEVASVYLMGIVWTVNPLVEDEDRAKLLQTLRSRLVRLKTSAEPILEALREAEILYPPDDMSLTEVRYDREKHVWISFKDLQWPLSEEDGENVVVPNEELCRNYWLLRTLMEHHTNAMILGNPGSAKSLILRKIVEKDVKTEKWIKQMSRFTGRISATSVQETVEDNYTKRFKSTYAPKASANTFLLCIDDLHLPNAIDRQSQNPLELIRELLSHGGMFDRRQNTFKKVIKLQLAATVGLKKGKLDVSPRIVSSFCLDRLKDLSESVLKSIFAKVLESGFEKYDASLKNCVSDLISLTLKVYKGTTSTFLPVPSKSHYRFSLKNVEDVFKGLTATPASKYEGIEDELKRQNVLYRLWLHECVNSFGDVLLDLEDKSQFEIMLKEIAEESTQVEDWTQVYNAIPSILFSNIVTGDYEETGVKDCTAKVQASLESYSKAKKGDLSVVLCETVIRQIVKIARVLSICRKHGLLIGTGGNGRTKLTQIACFILDYNFFTLRAEKQLGKTEWRENIKELFRVLGKEKNDTVFLCSEQAFRNNDELVDDLDSLLFSGTVPALFNVKEKDELMVGKKDKSYDKFLAHAKEHLRIVLCVNPIADILRKL